MTCVAISDDGKVIASSSRDNTVKIWDAEIFDLLHTLKGHKDVVYTVAMS